MKRAIVLAGVSGVGKTHTRLNDPQLRDLPHLDIADVYRQFPELDWMEAFWALVKRVREALKDHPAVVIEGYLLPNSTTRRFLLNDMKVAGVQVEVRDLRAPFEVCQERIAAQYERGEISTVECRRRIELLKQCWRPQEAE